MPIPGLGFSVSEPPTMLHPRRARMVLHPSICKGVHATRVHAECTHADTRAPSCAHAHSHAHGSEGVAARAGSWAGCCARACVAPMQARMCIDTHARNDMHNHWPCSVWHVQCSGRARTHPCTHVPMHTHTNTCDVQDDQLFKACNIVLPCWVLLALAPGSKSTHGIVLFSSLVLCALYGGCRGRGSALLCTLPVFPTQHTTA